MITHEDQMQLFSIISKELRRDITCFAFGGNAMMFYGYKDETKDIDLLFEDIKEREEFIRVIKKIGFIETSPIKIYNTEKLRDKSKPIMFKREDYRFDLFVKKIFRTRLSPKMKEDKFAVHEFRGKHRIMINIMKKEHIVQLKAITEREKDFADIIMILQKEKRFDWNYLIEEVIWQYAKGDKWAIIDMERTMNELKEYIFIEKKYFNKLYNKR